ncbi:MAG TPA: SDR family NAD(P)-dependent oxidoreductase [Mycobacteriales bacterium]|jgi:NAD(P)-dependent dehydrogenase (short-subunit alcohol dehydrogenase family)|nr:SDR family NAD(P)-dependent oxidoreductase [Mycobacteriales bacterium]
MTDQRTVLITGGTGGLGHRTAEAILNADQGWHVVVTGRSDTAVEATRQQLGDRAVGRPLDLGSLDDVRRFADSFTGLGLPPLHAVICNAGTQIVSGTVLTEDGIEQTFGVNHLAHFLLVQLLLPNVATPGRIVFVSSDTHDPTKPTGMPAPAYTNAWALAYPDRSGTAETESSGLIGRRRYTTSKLCNVMTTYELARQLGDGISPPAITVNAFDPGLMPGTGLGRDYHGIQGLAWRYLLPAFTIIPGLNIHTPRRSAAALARLVLDPELATTTGRYFSGKRKIQSSKDSYNLDNARDLWITSIKLLNETRKTA